MKIEIRTKQSDFCDGCMFEGKGICEKIEKLTGIDCYSFPKIIFLPIKKGKNHEN